MLNAIVRPASPWSSEVKRRRYTLKTLNCVTKQPFEEQEQLVSSLAAGMQGFGIRQYFAKQPLIFQQYDACVAAFENTTGRALGLLGGRWFDVQGRPYFYVWTAFVVDSHRGLGLFADMQFQLIQEISDAVGESAALVVLKTYSPAVYQSMSGIAVVPGIKMYPKIPHGNQDSVMVDLASRFLKAAFPALTLEPDTGVVAGGQASVGIEVFPKMPKCTTPEIQEYFESHLSPADQILCLVSVPPGVFPRIIDLIQQRAERLLQARNR
jgi:hypothetical protein